MSKNNPQNEYMQNSKYLTLFQNVLGVITFFLAMFQCSTHIIPGKAFLTVSAIILVVDFFVSHVSSSNFDKGHAIRQEVLWDNSFSERRIPNYDSETYYNNGSIRDGYIKLLANIHENALFTSNISSKMYKPYFVFFAIVFVLVLIKLFMSGMDDYSSLLLSCIISSNFFNRAFKINSLRKTTENILTRINHLCNEYNQDPADIKVLLPKILEIVMQYENAIFESKIVLSGRIFQKLDKSLSEEWNKIKEDYSIYSY